jgi:UDP-glucuronate 4-epimerase
MMEQVKEKRVLVTGAAGFIGAHLVHKLLADGFEVVGVDNLDNSYDTRLKNARLRKLCIGPKFWFFPLDLADKGRVESLFRNGDYDAVVHLAAQPGVRRSLSNPDEFIASNLVAFVNVLEGIRNCQCRHFLFASSSSVYGTHNTPPFAETDSTDCPVSLYAATKKSNEVVAHAYSQLYKIPTTGLRVFTVYGPWGRPDMAVFKFVDAILSGRVLELYNSGQSRRDFTYVDDVVESIVRLLPCVPQSTYSAGSRLKAPIRMVNIGNHQSADLLQLVHIIEASLGRQANIRLMPMQPGDVEETEAHVDRLRKLIGFAPSISLEVGIPRFVEWYLQEYMPLGLRSASVLPLPSMRATEDGLASAARVR